MSYSTNPVVNDIVLTVVNDGNGSQCGHSYERRLFHARSGADASWYRTLARNYKPLANALQLQEAGRLLKRYYDAHIAEITS